MLRYTAPFDERTEKDIWRLDKLGIEFRLNVVIVRMEAQIARCMIIHQMLGTRISDTLTLRQDCLYKENGQDMIRIFQPKTRMYVKPVSSKLAQLIHKAIEHTVQKY